MAESPSLWKPFISVNNCALLCTEWRQAKKPHQTPNKKKKTNKESGISHHLPRNSWAVRVTPVHWGVFLFLTHSSLNAHQADCEVSLQECKQRSQLFGKQGLWFLWFGSNKPFPYAGAQRCPQSTTPDSWSIVRTDVPPWPCSEDDNFWQWQPEQNML